MQPPTATFTPPSRAVPLPDEHDANEHRVTLRFLAEPSDVNFGGKVHGGAVMKWIDLAGYACAVSWSGCYCVTAYVDSIRFSQPILIGSMVEVEAQLIYTGRTSLHIAIDVRARNPRRGAFTDTTHCVIVFVAVDAQSRPVPARPWAPRTSEEVAWHEYAVRLMTLRRARDEHLSIDPERT